MGEIGKVKKKEKKRMMMRHMNTKKKKKKENVEKKLTQFIITNLVISLSCVTSVHNIPLSFMTFSKCTMVKDYVHQRTPLKEIC